MDDQPLRKINYFTGFFLRAEDLQAAESYRDRTRWLHNILSHGSGVMRGYRESLAVTANPKGNELIVGTGLAIDPQGREILLVQPLRLPFRREDFGREGTVYMTLEYQTAQDDFRENPGNRDYSGHAFIVESGRAGISASPPDGDRIELARIKLSRDGNRIRDAATDKRADVDEIDMSRRAYTGSIAPPFLLQNNARDVDRGSLNVTARQEASVQLAEVKPDDRAPVFLVSVLPQAGARVRWAQEARTDSDGNTQFLLVVSNQENADVVVRWRAWRVG